MTSQERVSPIKSDDAASAKNPAAILADLLVNRFSCRAYQDRPVERAKIEQMLEIAQLTASWCNSQPWQVIVTEGEGTERIRNALFAAATEDTKSNGMPKMDSDVSFPEAYRGIYKERQREVGWQLYESVGVEFGDRAASGKQMLENFRFFGAPHMLVVTSERELGPYGVLDCGLYIGSLLLAAQSLGIGMIPQAAIAGYGPLIRKHFNIPDNRLVVLGASFGYPDTDHPANSFRSRRAGLDDAVQWVEE
ncbi:MAG: nitroreductase [Parasphingorhabdus sp.]|nr:nitroreductase [Parasphingorhabdus sp.]